MNRNVVIGMVGLAVVGGGVWWFFHNRQATIAKNQQALRTLLTAPTDTPIFDAHPQPRILTPAEVAVAVQGGLTEAQAREMALHPQARRGAGHF